MAVGPTAEALPELRSAMSVTEGEWDRGAIARPNLPQELAATFLNPLNAGFVGVLRFQNAAIARNESRTAQVETWKIRGI